MFTLNQIEFAHIKVKSGADFPKYIQEIKELGVKCFETWVCDSHTVYYGSNNFELKSRPKYEQLKVAEKLNKELFIIQLKKHQQGETDYLKFCNDCVENGIEKWIVNLEKLTCIYYDKKGEQILVEKIPH